MVVCANIPSVVGSDAWTQYELLGCKCSLNSRAQRGQAKESDRLFNAAVMMDTSQKGVVACGVF